jgi:ubiquitin-activating enzyme E1
LIESGTLGTSGNVLVVLPHVTEAYSSSQDPPEKQIPICTLHNFPNSIEHTLQWARDQFEGLFSNLPKSALKYIKEPTNFLRNLAKLNSQQRLEELKQLKKIMIIEKCQDFNDCIAWARRNWQENFHNIIIQLLYNFPPNQKNKNGLLFWSGVKRCRKC